MHRELDLSSAEWRHFVETHPDARFADLPAWRDLLVRAFGLGHVAVGIDGEDGRLAGSASVLVHGGIGRRRGSSAVLSASGGGLLWDRPATAARLLEAIEACAAERRLHHVRVYLPCPLPTTPAAGWQCDERFARVVLDLSPGLDAVWADGLRDKTRNQVRKARRYGFTFATGVAEVDAFHHVLNVGTRDLGSPCPGLSFFRAVAAECGRTVTFVVARDDGRPAAAALLVHHNGTTAIPWAITLRDYRPSSLNMLLYWTVAEEAVKTGSRRLDMGRSLVGSGTYGFKVNFGGRPEPLYYYFHLPEGGEIPLAHPDGGRFPLVRRVWSRLPAGITARLGPLALRRVL